MFSFHPTFLEKSTFRNKPLFNVFLVKKSEFSATSSILFPLLTFPSVNFFKQGNFSKSFKRNQHSTSFYTKNVYQIYHRVNFNFDFCSETATWVLNSPYFIFNLNIYSLYYLIRGMVKKLLWLDKLPVEWK